MQPEQLAFAFDDDDDEAMPTYVPVHRPRYRPPAAVQKLMQRHGPTRTQRGRPAWQTWYEEMADLE